MVSTGRPVAESAGAAAARPRRQGSAPAVRGPAASVSALPIGAGRGPAGRDLVRGRPADDPAVLGRLRQRRCRGGAAARGSGPGRPGAHALADEWARARRRRPASRRFVDPGLELTEEITGRVTPSTVQRDHAAQALVSQSLDDIGARQQASDGFTAESRQPCDNAELLLGRAGTLLGAAILHEAVAGPARRSDGADRPGHRDHDRNLVRDRRLTRDQRGHQTPLPRHRARLGGHVLATLRWSRTAAVIPPSGLGERLDQLARLAVTAGTGLRWPWTNDGTPTMPGGQRQRRYVHLWTAAHTALRDDRWAVLAERAAWDADVTPALPSSAAGSPGRRTRCWSCTATPASSAGWRPPPRSRPERRRPPPPPRTTAVSRGPAKGDGVAVLAADLERPEMASMPSSAAELTRRTRVPSRESPVPARR